MSRWFLEHRNVAPRVMGVESVAVTWIDQKSSGTVPPTVPATRGALVQEAPTASAGPTAFPSTDGATVEMPHRRRGKLVLVPKPADSPNVKSVVLEGGEALGSIDDTESVAVRRPRFGS